MLRWRDAADGGESSTGSIPTPVPRWDIPKRRRFGLSRFFVVALLIAGCFAIGLPESAQASSSVTYVQGSAFATGSRVSSTTTRLAAPVNGGDLLVSWFAQYNTAGQVQVSDNVNGAWTRAPASTAFQNDTGDIALYYIQNAKAASGGITITVTAGGAAFFQGAVGEYSGVAIAGPLDQIVSSRGVGTAVDTGPTPSVGAGDLVFSALVTWRSTTCRTPRLRRTA
jgi:hypothetical protein